jgi:hypothetical protein
MRIDAAQRFRAKVNTNGPVPAHCPELGPCHVWTASKRSSLGYGCVKFGGKTEQAHRVAFLLATGHWPYPCVLHRCDNPACVNPAHLREGTHAENSADRDSKGRRQAPKGEGHVRCKLTDSQVREIRAIGDTQSRAAIARLFGVDRTRISQLLLRPEERACDS